VRVLVTGGTGFIGKPSCIALKQYGLQVRATFREGKSPPEGVQAVCINDIGPDTDWRAALTGVDVIVHLAARAHVVNGDEADALSLFRHVNTLGTLNLAQQAASMEVQRFVFMSSIGVNGANTFQKPFTPDDPPAPHSPYAQSKYEAEQGLSRLASQSSMEVVIARPPLVYGPNAPGNFGLLLRWLQRGIPLPLGSVRNKRSFVALENLVDFITLCADRNNSPKAANEVFLISDGEDVSTPELLLRISRAYGTSAHLIPMPPSWLRMMARLMGKSATAASLLSSLAIDNTKTKDLLGWRPIISMDEQLRKIAEADALA
jgi:nucleoside-diphosphate-sugar epimerase